MNKSIESLERDLFVMEDESKFDWIRTWDKSTLLPLTMSILNCESRNQRKGNDGKKVEKNFKKKAKKNEHNYNT